MKKLIIFILLVFITSTALPQLEDDLSLAIPQTVNVQNLPDTLDIARDVLIKTNGNLFQCKVIEVNDSLVKYLIPAKDTILQIYLLSREEVYAIAYGSGVAMVINPELMGKKADIYPEDYCEAWDNFKKSLGQGSINVGVGFVSFYSPIKNAGSFKDEQTMPSVFAGYTFRIKGKLKAGVHLGVGGNELSKSGESVYDQMKISTEIDQGFFCLGLFGRYDILDGAIKPFIKGGIDFIGVNMTTTSVAESLDGQKASLKTIVHSKSIKPGLILRAGIDIYFGDNFGIYSDVGTGLSLVQVGVLFNLE